MRAILGGAAHHNKPEPPGIHAVQPARWRGAAPVLIHDDTELRVIFQPGGSDVLLITFGDAVTLADGHAFAADALARAHGLACLGFMAHRPNWYPVRAMARALPHIAYTLRAFGRRLTYGSSMGGYAALKHARLLGATDVIALAPQWSIDPAECAPYMPGYQECFAPDMRGMGIAAHDMAGRVALLFDPALDSDAWHARQIVRRHPDVTVLPVHCTDHHLGPALAGSEAMWAIMRAWLDGDVARAMRLLNRKRRSSPVRTRVLLDRAVPRHPAFACRAIAHALQARDGAGVDSRAHIGPLLETALANGNGAVADHMLHRLASGVPQPRREALRRALAAGGVPPEPAFSGLTTAHGGQLCYNLVRGGLGALPLGSPRPVWCRAATLARPNDELLLVVATPGRPLACARDAYGQVELAEIGGHNTDALVRAQGTGGRFTLKVGGRYVSALPDGQMCHDRLEAHTWEVFRVEG